MTRKFIPILVILLGGLLASAGCGKGGGAPAPSSVPAAAPATKAVITLATQGTLTPSTRIGGIDGVIHLPANVTVKASAEGVPTSDAGVLSAIDAAAGAETVQYTFTTLATDSTHSVHVLITKTGGFLTGNFAVVNCDIGQGVIPSAADFSLADFKVLDAQTGSVLAGVAVTFNVVLR